MQPVFDWLPDETLCHVHSFLKEYTGVLVFVCRRWKNSLAGVVRENVCCTAAFYGHITLLEWARGEGCFVSIQKLLTLAARGGQLGMAKLLQQKRRREFDPSRYYEEEVCAAAARSGNLELLKWLRLENRPPFRWNESTCFTATAYGHFHLLKWAVSNGCEISTLCCAHAARAGNLEILKWLRAQNCPWNERATSWAAEKGKLDVLIWMLTACDKPCTGGYWTCRCAIEGGHLETIKWLHQHRPHWFYDDRLRKGVCETAAYHDHLEVLKWARSEGFEWGNAYQFCGSNKEMSEWALQNGILTDYIGS